jgi:hypothetical protein
MLPGKMEKAFRMLEWLGVLKAKVVQGEENA